MSLPNKMKELQVALVFSTSGRKKNEGKKKVTLDSHFTNYNTPPKINMVHLKMAPMGIGDSGFGNHPF